MCVCVCVSSRVPPCANAADLGSSPAVPLRHPNPWSFVLQVGRAASLLRGALLCYCDMRNMHWALDTERRSPLCMSQYKRVFGATRIPGISRDRLITYTTDPPADDSRSATSRTTKYEAIDPQHVVVMCENRFFSFGIRAAA